ncbi:hypothetical protein Tco_0502521 [Tanacetum coccineum]
MDLYHSRLAQDDLDNLIIKYKIPRDLYPRLPLEEFLMSKLPDDAIDRANGDLRHPDAAIGDPRPAAGSVSMADVRRLSVHVIKLRDMPEGMLVLSGLSRVWKSRICDLVLRGADGNVMGIHDFLCLPEWTGAEVQEEPHLDVRPTLKRLPFYCTPPAAVDAVILNHTLEDLVVGTPSSKILVKAEASQKQKASTFGATLSHVAKRTRSALAQSSGSTTRPSLFMCDSDDESDGDDDACVEISLLNPLRSAAVIPSSRNQGRNSTAPVAEGRITRDSRGKGIMADDAVALSVGVSRLRPSFGLVLSFRDVSEMPFMRISSLFLLVHIMPPILKMALLGIASLLMRMDQFLTPDEMVQVEALSEDQLTIKISVLHCMIISHGGELLARYHGLLQSHHEYVQSADSRLKGYEEKVAGAAGLELQSKAKGKERKKKIKSLTKSLDNLHAEVARLSAALNQVTVLEAEKDEEILRLKTLLRSRVQGELLSLAASAGFERGLSMHRTKDEFATVLKKMTNFMPGAQDRLAEASPLVVRTDYAFLNKIFEHATEPLSVIL